jgi:hypothetical protein
MPSPLKNERIVMICSFKVTIYINNWYNMEDFDSPYRTDYDSYFDDSVDFRYNRRLIKWRGRSNDYIGLIDGINSIGEYEVTVILPIYRNGNTTTIDKSDIITYITKSGWAKIDKYINNYRKAKERKNESLELDSHEQALLKSNQKVDAYLHY